MKNIFNIIKDKDLTTSEKIVIDYIIENPYKSSYMTSTNLAKEANVSNATVIRLAKKLGFAGYPELKKELQDIHIKDIKTLPSFMDKPIDRIKLQQGKSNLEKDKFYLNFYEQINIVNKNIESILKKNHEETIYKFIDTMLKSNKLFIYGSRSRSGIASYTNLILSQMLEDTFLIDGISTAPFDAMSQGKKEDCLLIFSFSRYSNLDINMAKMAKELGMKVLLISDNFKCPISSMSNYSVFIDINSKTFFNSYTAIFFFVDLLCSIIAEIVNGKNENKLEIIDKYISLMGLY